MRLVALACSLAVVTVSFPGQARPQAAPAARKVTKSISYSVLEDYDKGSDLNEVARDFELMRALGVNTWRGRFFKPDRLPCAAPTLPLR